MHNITGYGVLEIWLISILTSAIDGVRWLASRFGRFFQRKESPMPIVRLEAPESCSGRCGEETNLLCCRESNPESSIIQDID
jgi:hypothetical protein